MAGGPSRKKPDVRIRVEPDVAPWIYRWTGIAHYYGDYVRTILIAAAILMLVTAPFYADDLSQQLPIIMAGAVAVVAAAALTNPWKRSIVSADTLVSAVGFIFFETWALGSYATDMLLLFVLRQAIALLYMLALYFSLKTLRNMFLHKIGQVDTPEEFIDPEQLDMGDEESFQERARDALEEVNEEEKREFTD